MQDAKGKTLAVGDKIAFSVWDESDKRNPVASPKEGVVVALNGADYRDERAGEVVVESGKKTLTFSTGAVEKV